MDNENSKPKPKPKKKRRTTKYTRHKKGTGNNKETDRITPIGSGKKAYIKSSKEDISSVLIDDAEVSRAKKRKSVPAAASTDQDGVTPRKKSSKHNDLSSAAEEIEKSRRSNQQLDPEEKLALYEAIFRHLFSIDEPITLQAWSNVTSETNGVKEVPNFAIIQPVSTIEETLEPPTLAAAPTNALDSRDNVERRGSHRQMMAVVPTVPDPPLHNSFRTNEQGEPRSDEAARKALQRNRNRIKEAIQKAGATVNQRADALKSALRQKDLKDVAEATGYIEDQKESKNHHHMEYLFDKIKVMLGAASTTANAKGRTNNDRSAFVETIFTALAPDEDDENDNRKPSVRKLANLIGIPRSTTYRKLEVGTKKRQGLLAAAQGGVQRVWSQLANIGKGHSKITPEITESVCEWVKSHPNVIISPIANDAIFVGKGEERRRVPKLVREISVRELHNMMILPESEGGLGCVLDASGNVIVSDTSLRRIIKKHIPQLRPSTNRHMQMCGCEICISMRSIWEALTRWRTRKVSKLKKKAEEAASTAEEKKTYNLYKAHIDKLPEKASGDLDSIMCKGVETSGGHRKMICTLRRCAKCPKYKTNPIEAENGDEAETIKCNIYLPVIRCCLHKKILETKECPLCEALPEGSTKGKISVTKELTTVEKKIGDFMSEIYLPMLERYAYHLPHVKLLGKKWCGEMRRRILLSTPHIVGETVRDYAERLQGKFNWEIQSAHWGWNRSLSIEGCSIVMFDLDRLMEFERGEITLEELQKSVRMEMHSHFSDDSKQDAASTFDNMEVLLEILLEQGRFTKNGGYTLLDNTDGCAAQYRSANALYLISLLAVAYGLVIDRAVGAPGHGKDLVDGLNAVDKRFLQEMMKRLGLADKEIANRMDPVVMEKGVLKSLAELCLKACSNKNRKEGVKSAGKYAKREAAAAMRERHYHLGKPQSTFWGLCMQVVDGFLRGKKGEKHNGLRAMYHLIADPELGLGRVAVRRIPCGCDGCYKHLKKPIADRYKPHKDCKDYLLYEGLNDWHILTLGPKTPGAAEQVEEAKVIVVQGTTEEVGKHIKKGSIGAFSTDDPDADGYYIVEWLGEPFVLEEDCTLDTFDPPQHFKSGELVVYAKYFNKVQRAPFWYTASDSVFKELIKVQHVLAADLKLLEISTDSNPLPRSCNRREAERRGAKKVSETDRRLIQEQIERNMLIEYVDDNIDYESEEEDENDEYGSDSD